MREWLIELKGRKSSGPLEQNFLWKHSTLSIYIMDNHRAALWCWLREISNTAPIGYAHIDRHYDCRNGNLAHWIKTCPNIKQLTIQEYLDEKVNGEDYPLFTYDNYGSIFLEKYKKIIKYSYFATYKEGDKPLIENITEIEPHDVIDNLDYWTQNEEWIFNVDLDYFFFIENDIYYPMYSDQFITSFFTMIKAKIDNNQIKVLTIALSPEHCGSWENAEKVCAIASSALDIDFQLPR